jgi:two-component system sensor histidine kinase KdpD
MTTVLTLPGDRRANGSPYDPGILRRLLSPAAALGVVALATSALVALDASFSAAALALVLVVVLAALLGLTAGLVGAAAAFLSLNYFFTPPTHSLHITKAEDLIALLVFAGTAVALGTTIARVNTLRRRAELREREARTARLDAEVEQSRAAFLAAMTHNLRTPLATIKALVSTLRSETGSLDDETQRELLSAAYSEADRLDQLVTKVLALGRIRSGMLHPELEAVDVDETVELALRRVDLLAQDHPLTLTPPASPTLLQADSTMLELALANVLENAFRHTPPGSPVELTASALPGRVRFCVADHGPGIPREERSAVFDEFVRGRGSRDTAGSGIGLTITQSFVQALQGSVALHDTPGGGLTVTIEIPRDTEVLDDAHPRR